MDRSVFHAVKDHQQIQKYDNLNSYTVVIDSHHSIGYNPGVSPHNQFTINFADNQTSHIKNAKIRLQFLGLPISSANTFGFGALLWSGSKNAFKTTTGGGMGRVSNLLSVVSFKEVVEIDTPSYAPAVFGGAGANVEIPKVEVKACIGEPVSDNFVYCDNPFGKKITFTVTGENLIEPNNDLGNANDERVVVVIEVVLLPDNQANDKFSY